MEHVDVQRFADRWIADWNAHDLDGVLAHFADDVVFTSPVAARVLGGDGVVRGKTALRAYWERALRANPNLHFELVGRYAGVHTLVINLRNHKGGLANEVLIFDGPLIVQGHGTYLEE